MKCKRCGNTVLPNQVFCNKCGAPVVEDDNEKSSLFDDEYESKKKKNHSFIIIISVISALIIILLVVLFIVKGKDKDSNNNNVEVAEENLDYVVVYEDYNFKIPENYSQSSYGNRLNIYGENNNFLGAIELRNTTYSKAVANKNQLIESKIKNTTNTKYSILNQEQRAINGVNCYVYEVQVTITENEESINGYCYIAISEFDENNIAIITAFATEDKNGSYKYLEKLINIEKTAEKRVVNTSKNKQTNTVTNKTTNNNTKNSSVVVTNKS